MLYNSRTQAEYDALPNDIKAEYKKTGDNYTLQHDEDVGAIKRARDREKQRADDLATDRDAIKAEVRHACETECEENRLTCADR